MSAPGRMLVVDDDAVFAETLARALARRGHPVAVALDGEAALDPALAPLDAVVLDLRLAADSGLRLIPLLKAIHPEARILLLTGYASIATAVEAIKLGAVHYLAKPAGVDEILQASVEESYADFLGHVGKARKITPAALDRIAQGRVWDGGSARQIGLVDQFGGLDDALAWAAKEAKLKDGQWYAKRLGTTPSSYDSLIRQMLVDNSEDSGAASADLFALLARQRGHALQQIAQDAERLTRMQGVQAYCLECPREVQPAPTRHLEGWLAMFARLFARD